MTTRPDAAYSHRTGSPPPLLIWLAESQPLAQEIARRAQVQIAPLEERAFEEGEFKLRPLVSVRDRTVFVVESLAGSAQAPVTYRLVKLLFLLFGLHDAGASQVIAVVPYLSFARKDRRTQLRDPVTTRYVAELLEATHLSRLVCLDVHNPAALDNAFRIPMDHLSAIPMFVRHFAEALSSDSIAVASPDVGGVKRAQVFKEMLSAQVGRDLDLVFVEKRRAKGVTSGGTVVGSVEGREVIVLDDLCASGGTLIRAAESLRSAGASAVHVAFTHAPLHRGLAALAGCPAISTIVTTNSVGAVSQDESTRPKNLIELDLGPLLGDAVSRLIAGAPLAPLLQRWPPVGG